MSRQPDTTDPPPKRPWQFSLGVLLVVMTLAALVAAAFARDEFLGIWSYLGCFSLFMIAWRTRAGFLAGGEPIVVLAISIAVGLASAIAFVTTCTVPTTAYVLSDLNKYYDSNVRMSTQAIFVWVLACSMLLGTAAALGIYRLSWPRKKRSADANVNEEC